MYLYYLMNKLFNHAFDLYYFNLFVLFKGQILQQWMMFFKGVLIDFSF